MDKQTASCQPHLATLLAQSSDRENSGSESPVDAALSFGNSTTEISTITLGER